LLVVESRTARHKAKAMSAVAPPAVSIMLSQIEPVREGTKV
jgi:hypothetical protein